ncbi:hypothetical protein ALC60_01294 [Trachymyrmex zeteki]|uniref:Uncharacterized protein n=1 Tax=Mycetomoellerius zeteki TaxID=64791 RepID=A0A151XH55_9HYME|nr:hypothetical protein ALC60_01294 [Trachymyrmex zeteki]
MTDGHGRTNTVGHRAVRGQRMPPDVSLQCVVPRRAFFLVQACLEDTAWWRCPPLLFSHSLSLSLTRHPLPSPLSPATPHATQHKPHQRRETRHMSGTTFEAANPDSRRKPPCATCRPSRSTFDEARHTSERSNMAATYRSVANH